MNAHTFNHTSYILARSPKYGGGDGGGGGGGGGGGVFEYSLYFDF